MFQVAHGLSHGLSQASCAKELGQKERASLPEYREGLFSYRSWVFPFWQDFLCRCPCQLLCAPKTWGAGGYQGLQAIECESLAVEECLAVLTVQSETANVLTMSCPMVARRSDVVVLGRMEGTGVSRLRWMDG